MGEAPLARKFRVMISQFFLGLGLVQNPLSQIGLPWNLRWRKKNNLWDPTKCNMRKNSRKIGFLVNKSVLYCQIFSQESCMLAAVESTPLSGSFHMLMNTNFYHCGMNHQSNTRILYCYCIIIFIYQIWHVLMPFTAQATLSLSVPDCQFCLHSELDGGDPIWRLLFFLRRRDLDLDPDHTMIQRIRICTKRRGY